MGGLKGFKQHYGKGARFHAPQLCQKFYEHRDAEKGCHGACPSVSLGL